jgi:DNA ligase (NAD+)
MKNVAHRINELVRLVKYYDYMLHLKGETIIADEIYDAMRKELESLESMYPQYIRKDSPSLYIGQIDTACDKIIHRSIPMLSLRHTYNKNEILSFVENSLKHYGSLCVEPKIDGVAISVAYINGLIDSISLRGDGYKGEDITHFSAYIHNLQLKINDFSGEIRGEIITPKNIIKNNNRNYVSGALRRKQADDFNLKFFPYKVINFTKSFETQQDSLVWLINNGFEIANYYIIDDINQIDTTINSLKSNDCEFFTDGIVIKINDLKVGEKLGITNRYPRDAIAFKFAEKLKNTTIMDIKWNINRIGALIPVLVLNPIEIDGSKITKVHGFNKRYLENNNLGINSIVTIARVGDVIPQISNIIQSSEFIKLNSCPFCNNVITETDINYLCVNINCKEKNLQIILYFFESLKIDGLSIKILNRFFDDGLTDLIGILKYINRKSWIIDKNDSNAYNNWLQRLETLTMKDILIALGINGVSKGYLDKLNIVSPDDLQSLNFTNNKKDIIFKEFIDLNYKLILEISEILLCNKNNEKNN